MFRWAGSLLVLAACEERGSGTTLPNVADVSAPAPSPAPLRSGCVRNGVLDGIDTDPACVVKQASEDANRAISKQLAITISPELLEVVTGSSGSFAIAIKNVSNAEVTVYFEARHRLGGPRTDWTRVTGVPDINPMAAEAQRLLFPTTTTDLYDRDVDAVPTVANSNAPPSPPTILAVILRPGAKLIHNVMWWALRIPAPAPIFTDDAGHRYVPKTQAVPLYPADYKVAIDLPLYGLGREERKLTSRVHVVRPPLLDGGARSPY